MNSFVKYLKRSLFLLCFVLSTYLFSQDLIIDFAAQGASTEVTSVEILNLSNCSSITKPGNSTLNLSNYVTNINDYVLEDAFAIAYPNPFKNFTNIEFNLKHKDNVLMTVLDVNSKGLFSTTKDLQAGRHSFKFNAPEVGVYFVQILGKEVTHSLKLICLSANTRQVKLVYNENTSYSLSNTTNKKGIAGDFFSYNYGDTLKLTGISGDYDYATVLVDQPIVSKTYTFNFVECTDGDGNNYPVMAIGDQLWMAENLKTTSYSDGTAIPLVDENYEWGDLGDNNFDKAYCYYMDDEANANIYGALYTWATASNGESSETNPSGVQGACPANWHLPSDLEWTYLTTYLGGFQVCGGKILAKCSPLWNYPEERDASNITGFSALPGSSRGSLFGIFELGNMDGCWWTTTQSSDTKAWQRILYWTTAIFKHSEDKSSGYSVRCVHD